jgi:hypothetical protein
MTGASGYTTRDCVRLRVQRCCCSRSERLALETDVIHSIVINSDFRIGTALLQQHGSVLSHCRFVIALDQ